MLQPIYSMASTKSNTRHARGYAVIGISMAIMSLPSPSMAQVAPSRTVPDTIAPKVEQTETGVTLPETRLSAAPEGAENLSVRVGRIDVSGGLPHYVDAVAQIISTVEGRGVSIAELYRVAAKIETLYAKDGYILTRATVPPQELKDGAIFRIVIVEGFIESIDDRSVPVKVRGPVGKRLAALIGQKGLTLKDIERRVLLAARVPGVSLSTTLVPGERPGAARLMLQAKYKLVTAGMSIDNMLSEAYDNWNIEARMALNSPLGKGEHFYALGSTTTDFKLFEGRPMRRIVGIGFAVPLSDDGLTLSSEYLHADTNAKPPIGGVPISGTFDRVATVLKYPLVLRRRESLNLSAGFEVLNEYQSATDFGLRLSEDRLRFATFGIDWAKAVGADVSVSAQAQFVQGIDGLGARDQAKALTSGVLLSRQGSKPDFTKVTGGFSLDRTFHGGFNGRLIARGQVSLSGALPAAAQFSLDGGDVLSGFSLGSINVDSGLTGRFEFSKRFELGSKSEAVPYLFAAVGTGNLARPTALERKHPKGWSIGGGVRTSIADQFYLNAELSRSGSNILTKSRTRLMIGAGVQF